ncbi:MAG: serine acetyltransferase [Polyangiaceae bacterium]|nr:serine acetyltransferase [Polyangiaceae bacterium]
MNDGGASAPGFAATDGQTGVDAVQSELDAIVHQVLESYRADPRGKFVNKRFLPSREEIISILELFFQLFYPGYFGRQDLTDENLPYHVGGLVSTLRDKLARQIELCLCHAAECGAIVANCADEAKRLANRMLARIPELRKILITDAQAAMDGDPAASGLHEVILAYPGLLATTVYRIAHELSNLGVPLLPRIMTEWAHAKTGADIHPGATIGPSFFIDHATGVVVGETSHIGANVKLYQGVTLGALSHPKDENGRVIRATKRHPTVEDNVTIYANATVLGGTTTLGERTIVGGSVFLTRTVPPGSRVALKPPELNVKTGAASHEDWIPDYEI